MRADVCLCSSLSFAFSHVVQAQRLVSSYISKGTTVARDAAPRERGGGVNQDGVHPRLWAEQESYCARQKKYSQLFIHCNFYFLLLLLHTAAYLLLYYSFRFPSTCILSPLISTTVNQVLILQSGLDSFILAPSSNMRAKLEQHPGNRQHSQRNSPIAMQVLYQPRTLNRGDWLTKTDGTKRCSIL